MARKTASLIFFYFGEDSYVRTLAQETVPVHKAMVGYDHSVLLHHEVKFGPFELSMKAVQMAEVVKTPTTANLVAELTRLSREGYVTDVFIFSHGSTGAFMVSKGTYGDNGRIHRPALAEVPKFERLRAVWQCNCYGASLNETWLNMGARVVMGTPAINFYPNRFNGFITEWNSGRMFGRACAESESAAVRTATQSFLLLEAARTRGQWGGCSVGHTILGSNKCAESYFNHAWSARKWWAQGKSGKDNMALASKMEIGGIKKTNKSTLT